MDLEIDIKPFQELTLDTLYALLQLRSQVFVVEQDCVYQDIDGKDQDALHILGYNLGKLVAYTRILEPGAYFKHVAIGRVVVDQKFRSKDFGLKIMKASMDAITERFGEKTIIEISAQNYLLRFYNRLGFKEEGETYLEDGIPHTRMFANK